MGALRIALGYDTERPYGALSRSPRGVEFRERKLAFVQKLTGLLDAEEIPRTFFLLGDFLDHCLDHYTHEQLREIFSPHNPLNDLQQHSYSHDAFRPIPGRPDKIPVAPEAFVADVERATELTERVLGVRTIGLRTPLGYDRDLSDGVGKIVLQGLATAGFTFVSSYLRSTESLCSPFTPDRQPHTYRAAGHPGMVEIPTQGWQDAVFSKEKVHVETGKDWTLAEITAHYTGLLEAANSNAGDSPYIALCLHPWAVMEYDSQLTMHRAMIAAGRAQNAVFVSYKQVAEEVLAREPH